MKALWGLCMRLVRESLHGPQGLGHIPHLDRNTLAVANEAQQQEALAASDVVQHARVDCSHREFWAYVDAKRAASKVVAIDRRRA